MPASHDSGPDSLSSTVDSKIGGPDLAVVQADVAPLSNSDAGVDSLADTWIGDRPTTTDATAMGTDIAPTATCGFWNGTLLTWTAVADLPSTVSALTVNPATGHFYAGGTGIGMYRSTDRGASWSSAATGLATTISFSGISVLTPCGSGSVCTDVDNAVYSTTGTSWTEISSDMSNSSGGFSLLHSPKADRNTLYGITYDGLMRSDDGGTGWIRIGKGLPSGEPADLATNPVQANEVYVGSGSHGFSGQGVFKSTDRGATFTAVNRGMLDVGIAAIAVAADGTVYAASSSKFYRSYDGGTSWLSASLIPGSGSGSVARIVVSDDLGGAVFVLFSNLEVQVSCDRGSSFQTMISKPSLASNSGFVPPPLLVSLSGAELTLMAGHASSGAFRVATAASAPAAVDGGIQDSGAIDGGSSFASPCPFWKSFRAKSWQSVADLPTAVDSFVADPASNDIFAGTNGVGVFKSVDQGATWNTAAAGLPTFSGFGGLTAMALCGASPTAICVGIGNAVYATTNGGISWSERASDMTNNSGGFDFLVSLSTNPSVLFGFGYTVFMTSSNGGAGWTNVGTSFPNEPSVMAASPTNPNLIYAGTGAMPYAGQGVYKSVDRGLNWTPANAGILDKKISALVVDGADKVWAVIGSALYSSNNGGSSWTDASAALPFASSGSIVQLVLGPSGSGAMFALRSSLQTEVTCDGGTTWYTVAPGKGGLSSGFTNPVLLPLGNAQQMVLLAGTEEDGGFRLVIE